MNPVPPRQPSLARELFGARMWPAWAVLASALMFNVLPWLNNQQHLEHRQQIEFDREVRLMRDDLDMHIAGYAMAMRAAAALFSASDKVTREDWRIFVTRLRLEQDYPATQALAFARSVSAAGLPALLKEMRQSGVGDYDVRPPGQRERYVVNVFAEPYSGSNIKALGYDMWQDFDRREAMQRAKEKDEPAITAKTTLKIDADGQPLPAIIMYLAVRQKSSDAVYGYVVNPLRIPHLMAIVLKHRPRAISLDLYDGREAHPDQLLYSSNDRPVATLPRFVQRETITVGGRPWTFAYASLPQLEAWEGPSSSTHTLAGGVLVSALLFVLVSLLATTRNRALRLADAMTGSLRESEARFRVLVDQAPDAITVYDADLGRFVEANAQAERLFGCSREQLLRSDPERFYPSDQFDSKSAVDPVRENVERALAGEQVFFERIIQNATGKTIHCEVRLVRLPSADHRLVRGSMIDITARKSAEQALQENQALLKTAQKAARLGHYVTDVANKCWTNDAIFDEIFGIDRRFRRDIGNWERILHPDDRKRVIDYFLDSMEKGEVFPTIEYRIIRPNDGELRWIAAWGYVIRDKNESPIRQIGFIQDISARKQTEMETHATKAQLEAILDALPDLLFEVDTAGLIHRYHSPRDDLLAAPADEILGKTFADILPEEATATCLAALREAEQTGWSSGQKYALQLSRGEHWFELSVARMATSEEILPRFVFLARDITERTQIERQLQDQNEHLEDLIEQRTLELKTALEAAKLGDRAKDAFLANMSHELRTPLNAVIGMAGLARAISHDTRLCDYLDKIVNSGKHLNRIINDLLDLSKIAAGHMELENLTFSLRALTRQCVTVMSHRAEEKGLALIEQVDATTPDILVGDPLRIEQIILNLVSNAIKFTMTGGVELRVSQYAHTDDRVCLAIEIEDTGIGIDAADLERLFEPFTQANMTVARRFGGTGLGLAISRRLARMLDGDIAVSSREGGGSLFRVTLCLRPGDPNDLPADGSSSESNASRGRYEDACVLVVEDQALNREIIEALLSAVGISARMAENGQEALDILNQSGVGAFDLVLMDIQMPVMDGLTATRTIRADNRYASLPIVAMTAHTMEHEKQISAAAGMNDHIGKPFDNNSFYRTLAKWLAAKQARHEPAPLAVAESADAADERLHQLRGVDVAAGLARFGGRVDRYQNWLEDFVRSACSVPDKLRVELASGRADAAAQAAHAFKGRVGMLGLDGIHDIVAALEQALRNGEPAEALLAGLDNAIESMCAEIQRVLHPATPLPAAPPALEQLAWRDEFSVGVAELDDQHRQLIHLVNQLAAFANTRSPDGAERYMEILSGMFEYCQQHFTAEEAYLQRIGYPELAAQEREHNSFIERMTEFSLKSFGGMRDIAALHAYLEHWLIEHILKSDMAFRDFAASNKRNPEG